MTERKSIFNRIISILVCAALLISYLPTAALKTAAADKVTGSASIVADPGTAHTWESMMGTEADGNRYAGRVWADKSVYTNGQTALLNSSGAAGSTFKVNLEDDEAFQVIFSALGSSMTTTTTNSYVGPMDVVLVLDTSTSMDSTSNGVTRLQRVLTAANNLLTNLLTIPNVRISIVTYNADSETVLPLDFYTNGITLSAASYYYYRDGDGVISARDKDGKLLGNDNGYHQGTNLQAGVDRGLQILADAENVDGRVPIAIVLTDGQANRAVNDRWNNLSTGSVKSSGSMNAGLVLNTLLNAAYGRACIEKNYGKAPTVYGIGVDLGTGDAAHALMNPGSTSNGFNSSSSHSNIRTAYSNFQKWSRGETVTYSSSTTWTSNQSWPASPAVTRQDIINNINYVDTYYDVSGDDLEVTFTQIYEELSSGVFNPISSSQTVTGGTGVQNTPLVYVDHIGQHMEVKRIQSITLFGASYTVTKNADGTYTVAAAAGVNPTTNENYNTAEDIRISIVENADGTQTLRVEIDQEILPIILEQVKSETVSGVTSAVINEMIYNPLRVYYTVGLDSDIFLPTGEIDVSKIDDNYAYIDDATGQITFYSNAFNKVNKGDANGNSYVDLGDAHIGFKPSSANRYYYYQNNVGIFSSVTAKDGTKIEWEEDEYGVLYEEGTYDITFLTYADYKNLKDGDTVYTYVTYHRPTPTTSDAANTAEEVNYITYSDWKYMKESAAFYDRNADTYINYDATNGYTIGNKGYAIDVDKVAATIAAYQAANASADIIVVLGVGSHRSSRLHNMTVDKTANSTGTADHRYAPEYTYETADDHSGNDVVVWLGNNGALTTTVATGIALTKAVTEAIGNADDTYALTVTIPAGVSATPLVKNANGEDVTAAIATYAGNILTVTLKAGETVYISGIPAGTECVIGEVVQGDYYIDSKTDKVTVPTLSQVLAGAAQYAPASVTNAPNKYGNLFITKEMTSDHTIPAGVLAQTFALKVNVGTALAGKTFAVKLANLDDPHTETTSTMTVDAEGNLNLTIQARQTIEILGLPEGTEVVVLEELTADQQRIFATTYRTRNHSGEDADADGKLTIPANANATAVITNHYTPVATTVDLDIAGTKNFIAEDSATLAGGSFTFKVQRWDGSAWVDMTSAVTAYAAGESGTKTFLIEDVLQGITYTETGSWTYQVLEVKGTLDNLTYDRTLYTFTVTVTDNGGALVATVTDLNNTEITDGSYEVTFTNTYHTAPVSIDVTKDLINTSGDDTVSKAGFAFTAVQTDAAWAPLAGGATLTVYSDGIGDARFTATYTQAGTYYYLISEVRGSAPGWTYSNAQYRVTVTVTEDGGNLISSMTIEAVAGTTANGEQASVSGNSGAISFVNTYDPQNVTIDLDASVIKVLEGKTLNANDFTFYVCQNGTVADVRNGNLDSVVLIGTNELNGNVTFVDFAGELIFDHAGIYEYDVVEMIPAEAVYDAATGKYFLHGMSYDATIYDLVVEVTNNIATGELEAVYYFEDSTLDTVTFRNVYTVTPTTYTFQGIKHLIGRAMSAGEFTFWLYEGDTPVEKVTNKADGSFTFSTITYTSAGTYTYTIREEAGSAPGVAYNGASNPITVTVTVTDTNGVLSAVADVANADITFENTYTANAATVTFDGTKTLVGALLADRTFTFKLYQTDSSFDLSNAAFVESVENVGGRYAFETLRFTQTGTFFYAIVEDASVNPQSDVVYDRTVHQFRVQVSDQGDGQLKVEVQNMSTGITTMPSASVTVSSGFTNATFEEVTEKEVYMEGSTETHIDGQKVNAGDILEYFITYTNYTGKDVTVDIMDTIPAHTSYVEGSASHGGSYVGTHVNWVLSVTKGESVTVSFKVSVDETDSVVANTAVVRDGVNTYHTNQVTNHTYDDVAEKDVFNANEPTVSIDKQPVALGDILLYTVRFTNTSSERVSITITDLIPANTSYVADSATLGGVYADGMLTWNLDVEAWASVTVSFQVKVTATEHVTIQNQASILEGENTYTTNVVTNEHTPDTTGLTVNKIWNDADNQDGIRPETITVHIYGNGKLVTSVQLTAAKGWTYTLTGLDKYENGSEIVYTVEEATVTGYTAVVTGTLAEGFTITNTHTPDKTQISATKVWDDKNNQDGKRPESITVHLLANGEHTGKKVELNAANGWTHTWTGLDKFHNGTAIVYTVFEEEVENYTVNYARDTADAFHVIITNSYTPQKTGLTVQKVWHDNDDQDGLRSGSVVVELYANGNATGIKVTLNAINNWCHSFTGLDKFADGKLITYTAVELTKVEGYEVSYKLDTMTGVYEVINTHEPTETQVSFNKVWNDANDQDGLRPDSIEVELYADGNPTGKKLTLNAANGWKGNFTNLDAYENGSAVIYTVREVNVPTGYTVAVTGSVVEGFTLTNTHQVEKTSITVSKVWNDQNNQDGKRPATITVHLYANGAMIATQTLDASMNWSYTWTDLDKNANGAEIVYTVDEVAVEGYTTSVDGLVITNSREVELTSLSVSKVWNDNDDQDGKRPESITVHLLADGEHTGLTKVLSAENGWSATWTELYKYAEGELINYTVHEVPVDGYYTTYERDSADDSHVIITNTYSPEKTAFAVLKVWNDGHNRDGLRREVVVELYANGKATGITATLKEANHWTHTFADLDKFADGKTIVYTVVELTELDGYTTTYRTDAYTGIYEIINTHVPALTQISVTKVWDDNNNQDGIRLDSIDVLLFANGVYTGIQVTLSEANQWKAVFTDLPVYEDGKAILYMVEEQTRVSLPGYTGTVTYIDSNTIVITNTHVPEVQDIPVEKLWEDNKNQDGKRPASVTIALIANGVDTSLRLALTEANNWSAVFTNVPVYSNGQPIVYTFEELNVPDGYTVRYEGNTIINTHVPEVTDISISKLWNDSENQDGIRPAQIEVYLLANGEHTGMKLVLSAENGWSGAWNDLPKYKSGSLIDYTVEEAATEGYVAEYLREGNNITIINTHVPETVIVSASKLWDDGDNRDGIRPDKVVFVLVVNGTATDKTLVLNEENNWYGEWTDLPKYENGQLISYTVVELDLVEGYVSIVDPNAQNPYDFTVTNQYAPMKTSLTAAKVWEDDDNALNARPESIRIALLANGQIVDEVELSEHNSWTYTWTDLYQYANGELIVYTVEEVSVDENYTVTYASGVGARGEMLWQITNTLVDSTPDTGDSIRPVIMAMLLSLVCVLALVPAVRKKEQQFVR